MSLVIFVCVFFFLPVSVVSSVTCRFNLGVNDQSHRLIGTTRRTTDAYPRPESYDVYFAMDDTVPLSGGTSSAKSESLAATLFSEPQLDVTTLPAIVRRKLLQQITLASSDWRIITSCIYGQFQNVNVRAAGWYTKLAYSIINQFPYLAKSSGLHKTMEAIKKMVRNKFRNSRRKHKLESRAFQDAAAGQDSDQDQDQDRQETELDQDHDRQEIEQDEDQDRQETEQDRQEAEQEETAEQSEAAVPVTADRTPATGQVVTLTEEEAAPVVGGDAQAVDPLGISAMEQPDRLRPKSETDL